MEGITTVGALRKELKKYDDDLPVMIAVVKYPEEFALKQNGVGEISWMDSTDVEVVPLEMGDVTQQGEMLVLTTELMDYDAQRHFAGG